MDTLLLVQEKIGMNMSAMLEARKMGPIGRTTPNSCLGLVQARQHQSARPV